MSFLARDPRQLFEMLRTNPEMLQQARRTSPQLADAIQRGDFGTENFQLSNKKKQLNSISVVETFMQLIAAQSPEMQQRIELDRLASLDPFDPEVQRRIHDIIKSEQSLIFISFESLFQHAKRPRKHGTCR